MPAGPAQYKIVVLNLNLFTEGSQIQIYDFVRESHQNNFNASQFTHFVLLLQNEIYYTKNEVLFIGIAR